MAPKAAEPQGRKGEKGARGRARKESQEDRFGKKSDKVCDYPKKDIEFRTLTGVLVLLGGSGMRAAQDSAILVLPWVRRTV